MGVSLLLCLLPALLATASVQAQITCQECSAQGANCPTAENPVKTCSPPKDKGGCIIVAEDSTLEGISSATGFSRGCIADFNVGLKEALTFTAGPGLYVRINTTRCNKDNCNSGDLPAPTENITSNGLQCPSCFAVDKKSCTPVTIPCTGNENFCVDLIGEITKGTLKKQFAAQGCATPSSKSITDGSTLVSATYTFNFETAKSQDAEKVPSPPAQPSPQPCTQSTSKTTLATTSGASPAPGQVPFALFLPGLTGLLLVKLLS